MQDNKGNIWTPIEDGAEIPYKWKDDPGPQSLGHAEFMICAVRGKNRKITEVIITRKQQHENDREYRISHWGAKNIHLSSHPDNPAQVWMGGICDSGHFYMNVYVPRDTSVLKVNRFSDTINLNFR